jgi:hypothetical protein
MGTQQLLMILLSVIIVGIAIAVGITMFNQQATRDATNQIVAHMNLLAAQAHTYWKLPTSMGGASYNSANLTDDLLSTFLGAQLENEVGSFYISCDSSVPEVSFGCTPYEKGIVDGKAPIITVNLSSGVITANMTGNLQDANGF